MDKALRPERFEVNAKLGMLDQDISAPNEFLKIGRRFERTFGLAVLD